MTWVFCENCDYENDYYNYNCTNCRLELKNSYHFIEKPQKKRN